MQETPTINWWGEYLAKISENNGKVKKLLSYYFHDLYSCKVTKLKKGQKGKVLTDNAK
jgi:hypothetical protein